MKKIGLFLFTIVAMGLTLLAQKKPRPVIVSVINESTAIPYTKLITTPVHPGIMVGTGFTCRKKSRSSLYQQFNAGYLFHRKLYHGLFLNTELGYDYQLNFGLNIKAAVGLGYLHTFSTQREYQFKNGEYENGRDKGNSHAMFSISTGLGYRLKKNNPHSPEVFMMYQGWAEYPYSPGFIPVMTHINLHVGTKFFINL